MKIRKLSEDFTPSTILATTNKKAPAETHIDLVLSSALVEEEIFTENEEKVMEELHKNDVVADKKDDK